MSTATILRAGVAATVDDSVFESIIASAVMRGVPTNVVDAGLDLWYAAGYSDLYAPGAERTSKVVRVPVFQRTLKLYDEPSTREKALVMDTWDVMTDDERNPDFEGLEEFLEWGSTYRITIEKV